MKPTIKLLPRVGFDLGGNVTLSGVFSAPSPFEVGEMLTVTRTFDLPQPEVWATDDDLLVAVRAMYPDADVEWLPKQD